VFNIKPIELERIVKFSGELAQKVHRAGDKKVKFTALV